MWDDLDEVGGRRGKSKAEGEQGGINPPHYTERHTARVYILHEISETTEEGTNPSRCMEDRGRRGGGINPSSLPHRMRNSRSRRASPCVAVAVDVEAVDERSWSGGVGDGIPAIRARAEEHLVVRGPNTQGQTYWQMTACVTARRY